MTQIISTDNGGKKRATRGRLIIEKIENLKIDKALTKADFTGLSCPF